MNLGLIIPIFLGFIGILQGGINRHVSNIIGVAQAALIGNIITVGFCVIFYLIVRTYNDAFPSFVAIKAPLWEFRWWFIFPAFFGFCIVAGLPYAIYKVGAVKVTVSLIAAQMLASVTWDIFIEKIMVTPSKALGMGFAILSVIFMTISK